MEQLKRLASLLCLVLCFSSYSKADPLTYIYNDPAVVSYNLADDGDVYVPLSFMFPYFDQYFSQSWMYSNGVIDFKGGGMGYCCDGYDLSTLQSSSYNYMLMPFWADLIASTTTSFYTLDTGQSITYGWYNTNEYGTNNKSSFEVQLFANGEIDYRYSSATAVYHNVTIGMTGNLTAGQYLQYYHGKGTNISNTTYTANFAPPPPVDPCVENPLSSISCPGYFSEQVIQDVIENKSMQTQPTTTTQTGVVEDATSTYNEVRTDAGGASITSTGSIKVEDGIPDVVKNAMSTNEVTTGEINLNKGTVATVDAAKPKEEPKKSVIVKPIEKQASISTGTDDFDLDQYINQSTNNMNAMQSQQDATVQEAGYETPTTISVPNSYNNVITNSFDEMTQEQNKSTTIDLNKNDVKIDTFEQKESNESVKKDVEPNEAASGGIDAAEFARPIDGFLSYSKLALTDSNFYKTKEIYKDQKTVDNQSILRRLNAKSDKLHGEMVNQQYR